MPKVPTLRDFIDAVRLRRSKPVVSPAQADDAAEILRGVELTALELSFELAAVADTAEFRVGAHSGLWRVETLEQIHVFDLVLAELASYRPLLPAAAVARLDRVLAAWEATIGSIRRATAAVRESDLPVTWPTEERPHARLLACRDALLEFGGVGRAGGLERRRQA